MFRITDRLEVDDISDNFLVRRGLYFSKKAYYRNHIKIIDNADRKWLREYLNEMLGESVDPFIMTNIGYLVVYMEDRDQIAFYYLRSNTFDEVFDMCDIEIEWVLDNYLNENSLVPLFNKDLFRFNLGYDEILFLPMYLNESKYNYKSIPIKIAFNMVSQGL